MMADLLSLIGSIFLAFQDPPPVRVALADGTEIEGQLLLREVKVAGDVGEHTIPAERIRTMQFGPEGDRLTTAQFSLRGTIRLATVRIKCARGEQELPRDKVRRIRVIGAPSGMAGAPETPDNELRPASVLPLNAVVAEMLLSPDGAWLYFLETGGGKVRRVDTAKRALDPASAGVGTEAVGMCLSPNGKSLYVIASAEGLKKGKILAITAETLQVRATIALDFNPEAIQANGQGLLFCLGAPRGVAVVDSSKKAVVRTIEFAGVGGKMLRLSPDQKRLFIGGRNVLDAPADPTKLSKADPGNPFIRFPGERDFVLTPEGTRYVGCHGSVQRLAMKPDEDFQKVCRIEPFRTAATDGQALFTVSPLGTLKMYSTPDLAILKAWSLPTSVSRLAFQAKSRILYALSDRANLGESHPEKPGPGDLQIYDLSTSISEPVKK